MTSSWLASRAVGEDQRMWSGDQVDSNPGLVQTARHAFLIMAHCDAWQLSCLLSALDDPRNDIFVHLDRKGAVGVSDLTYLPACARVEFIESSSVNWGGFSQVDCTLRLLRAAASAPHSYYHLLSGADLPLVTQEQFHDLFGGDDRVEYVDVDEGALSQSVLERVILRHPFVEREGWYRPRAIRIARVIDGLFVGVQRSMRIENRHVKVNEIRKGSQWFSITGALTSDLLDDEKWVRKAFRFAWCSDEMFLQTWLKRRNRLDRISQNRSGRARRIIDWSAGGRSPHTWTLADLPRLRSAGDAGLVFARKFSSEVDAQVTMGVMQMIGATLPCGSPNDQIAFEGR